ncbi:MAG: erythromycin esterase family protein [Aureispira sp.]|nr:erythromycin esterase family protein [Aureispira sp.]
MRYCFLSLFLLISVLGIGQTTWDSLGALPIVLPVKTISPYDSLDRFEDLAFLKEVLKDKRVVMLGESMHGVEDFNEAKTRIIKFLHQEMDFEVVAFESELSHCEWANRHKQQWSAKDLLKHSIFRIWNTPACLELMKYIQRNEDLVLTGFDMQPEFDHDSLAVLYQFFKPVHLAVAQKILNAEKEFVAYYKNYPDRTKLIKTYQKCLKKLQGSKKISSKYSTSYIQLVQHILSYRIETIERFLRYENPMDMGGGLTRDSMMAENVDWLLKERYPDKKIIVWAHNAHIGKNITYPEYGRMGHFIQQKWAKESYVMAFCYATGKVCHLPEYTYENTSKSINGNSIQYMIYKTGEDLGFINIQSQLDNKWLNTNLYNIFESRDWFNDRTKMRLVDNYDGIFMCREARCPTYFEGTLMD